MSSTPSARSTPPTHVSTIHAAAAPCIFFMTLHQPGVSLASLHPPSWTTADQTIFHPLAFLPPRSFSMGITSDAYGTTWSASCVPNDIMRIWDTNSSWSAFVAGIISLKDMLEWMDGRRLLVDRQRRGGCRSGHSRRLRLYYVMLT